MAGADRPVDERHRLARLRELEILDTGPEPLFEKLTQLAAHLLKTPIALVSLVDADDRDMVAAYVEAAIEQREPFDFEARLVRADGMVRRVHSVGVPEIVGNRVVGVFGVFVDFTDRAELRERLVQAATIRSTSSRSMPSPSPTSSSTLGLAICHGIVTS